MAPAFFRRFLAPAEDPRERFPDAVDRRIELLDDLRAALQRVQAALRQLEERSRELRERTAELDAQARQALAAGDRTGARDAVFLYEKARIECDELQAEARRLSLGERRLGTLIDTYLARERLTHMRYDAAAAGVRVAEALAGLSNELGRPDLIDAEAKIRDLEARAAAIDELAAAGILDVGGDPVLTDAIDRRLAGLEEELAFSDVEMRPPRLRRG